MDCIYSLAIIDNNIHINSKHEITQILRRKEMSSPKKLEDISQESKDFISTLPSQYTQSLHPLYQHQGFWYHSRKLLGVISSQKHFEAQESDVFVITNPKCGTTWLKAIAFALLNRERHRIVSENHPLLTSNPHDLVPYIDMDLYVDDKIPDMESFPSPRLLATHMPYVALPDSIKTNSKCKLVYMSRNPKDTFVSLYHFILKLGFLDSTRTIKDEFERFCEGFSLYGPFWDHVLGYWKQSVENPDKILFLKYEEMKEEPRLHLHRLAKFLNCPFSADEEESGMVDQILELTSFDNLKSLEVNKTGKSMWGVDNSALYRKGEVGDWNNYLTSEMVEKIDQITLEKFSESGLVL